MKIYLPHPLPDHAVTLIKRAGYADHRDAHATEPSYTHRFGPELYPRFHVYIEERSDGVVFNLHLDQKKPSYGGSHAHAGEYDGPTVEREASRIYEFIKNYAAVPEETKKPKGFFGRLFGGGDDSL